MFVITCIYIYIYIHTQVSWKIDVWFYWLVACGCACCWLLRIRILFVIWQFPFCLCDWQGVVNIKNKLTSLLWLAQTCRWNSWISLKRLPTSVISPLDQVAWRGNSFQISLGFSSNCCTTFTTSPPPPQPILLWSILTIPHKKCPDIVSVNEEKDIFPSKRELN